MGHLDHLEHLDKHLVEELAQVARETVRDELREQTRRQRRTALLYAASGAVALYAGAAVALAAGLALAVGLPGWAAALITAAVLGAAAYALRRAARPAASGPTVPGRAAGSAMPGTAAPMPGTAASRMSAQPPVPPAPPVPPMPQSPPRAPGASRPQGSERDF
ncbi:phage holin family protein [Streptomyces sp. NPDC006743]|uniref:phage holin family protein n=1 Tax=Streptomyces sp. NPDC006743 TaxID=3154480 RepID=UPI0034561FFF